MSKHESRRSRWDRHGPTEHRSADGLVVLLWKGAWWAEVRYRLRGAEPSAGELPAWEEHADRLGPFKRPRNAMVEAERHATALRNRHGDKVRF